MPRRRVLLVLAGLLAVLFWRRAARAGERVEVSYQDGSLLRLDHVVEADDLLDDARELLAILA
jgi:hypothetical protein